MKHLGYIIACFVILFNVHLVNAQGDVKIGTQVWTSKNLDVNTFRNGDAILEAKNKEEWVQATENKQPAWCYYDNDEQNGKKYGKLYNWYAVIDSRGLAPNGYYIPSDAEWVKLINFLGGNKAGYKMKSKSDWQKNVYSIKSGNGNNSSGFNGLPGGTCHGGYAGGIGELVSWWSSSSNTGFLSGISCGLSNLDASVNMYPSGYGEGAGLSVRCIRENGDIKSGSNSNHVSKVENISEKINNTILQNYSTVTIGNQVWTTKNLDVSTFRNGEAIPEAKSKEEWLKAGENEQPAWCYYDNDIQNGKKYGKLYNWYAVNDSRGLAPKGYYIPSDAEWTVLTDFLGGDGKAGEKMKSKTGWASNRTSWYSKKLINCNGTNSSGFNGLPSGSPQAGASFGVGVMGGWWSSTGDSYFAVSRRLYFNRMDLTRNPCDRGGGFSVRCLRENGDNNFGSNSNHVNAQGDVKIGTQVWTSKNLDVSTFRNGEAIPEVKNRDEWIKAGENKQPAWCYYDNDVQNGKTYGKLYNWYAVNDSRGLAPKGYHIPSDAEWIVLIDFLGGHYKAGYTMKSNTGWTHKSCSGNNSSGFNGLPGGTYYQYGIFTSIRESGKWWSSKEYFDSSGYEQHFNDAVVFLIECDLSGVNYIYNKGFGLSVRCLRD